MTVGIGVSVAVVVGVVVAVSVAVAVLVGTGVAVSAGTGVAVAVGAIGTARHAENSEVLPAGSVAVAVTNRAAGSLTSTGTAKSASPLASVVTVALARNCSPWP